MTHSHTYTKPHVLTNTDTYAYVHMLAVQALRNQALYFPDGIWSIKLVILQLFLTRSRVTLMTSSTQSPEWHVLMMNDQWRTRTDCIKYRHQSRYHLKLIKLDTEGSLCIIVWQARNIDRKKGDWIIDRCSVIPPLKSCRTAGLRVFIKPNNWSIPQQ